MSQQEPLGVWFAELIWLTRNHGHASPRLWCERVRPEASVPTAERQWERLKAALLTLGVPHQIVPVRDGAEDRTSSARQRGGGAVANGIVMEIGPDEVDFYTNRERVLAEIAWRACVVALLVRDLTRFFWCVVAAILYPRRGRGRPPGSKPFKRANAPEAVAA